MSIYREMDRGSDTCAIGYYGTWFVVRLTVTYWNEIANVWTDNSKKLRSVLVFNFAFSAGFFLLLDWVIVGL